MIRIRPSAPRARKASADTPPPWSRTSNLAMKNYNVAGDWTAESLALFMQAVLQGAFILAKAKSGVAVARESIDHLCRYLELLFRGVRTKELPKETS